MKRLAILLLLSGTPAFAQDVEEPPGLFERRLEDLMRDLFSEIEPRLRELRDAIGNLDDYEAPEMLPNGDIIIRRKTPPDPDAPAPAPELEEPEIEDDGAIDI
jgi:hypothetical protein